MNLVIVTETTIRSAAILTTSYVAATTIEQAGRFNQLALLLAYTQGSLTSLEIKIEFSMDGTTFFRETVTSVSGGTSTLSMNEYTFTSTGNIVIPLPAFYDFIKVSAKGTGTVTSSSLAITAVQAKV